MKDTGAKPHVLVRALNDRVVSAQGANATILELSRMRRDARELRVRARRAEQDASLLERSIDGVFALRMLEDREAMDAEEAASA